MNRTDSEFEAIIGICHELFAKKLSDYGASWRIMRPSSVTDQIFIKAGRIRSIEEKGVQLIDDSIRNEFIGIINYSAIALIQLEKGYIDGNNSEEAAVEIAKWHLQHLKNAKELMSKKNHDYGEA